MSFNLCTEQSIIDKMGAFASTDVTASSALLGRFCDEAESTVCFLTRKDWLSATLTSNYSGALADAVSSYAAQRGIVYDKSGYTKLLDAQTDLDFLKNRFDVLIAEIKEKENQVLIT